MRSSTGYPGISYFREKFTVSIKTNACTFRRGNLPSIYDAVRIFNEIGLNKYPEPPSPYAMLDSFLEENKRFLTDSCLFSDLFDSIKHKWQDIAKAPLTKPHLSKLLKQRNFLIFTRNKTLRVQGLCLPPATQ